MPYLNLNWLQVFLFKHFSNEANDNQITYWIIFITFKSTAEALAFYLSRLLGMDNVPEVVLSRVNKFTKRWKEVDFQTMEWEENKEVAMMKWLNNTR